MEFRQTPIYKMNRRVELQSATTSTGSTGELIKTWTTFATVWAYMRTMTGNEKNLSQQVKSNLSYEITIRYSSDVSGINPDDRILYDSRMFDIKDVRNVDETNIEIRMLCSEATD